MHMVSTVLEMTADEFKVWMTAHGYSVRSLARAMERGPASIQRYRDGTWEIPRVVELALIGLEHADSSAGQPLARHQTVERAKGDD